MDYTDRDLWQTLQVVMPERESFGWPERHDLPGQAWIEWAKREILRAPEKDEWDGYADLALAGYAARFMRVMEAVLAFRDRHTQQKWREHGLRCELVYSCLKSGLVAAGLSPGEADRAYNAALYAGYFLETKVDEWHPGMPNHQGRNTYVRLTYAGTSLANEYSIPPAFDAEDTHEAADIERFPGPDADLSKASDECEARATDSNHSDPEPHILGNRITVCGGQGSEVRYIDLKNIIAGCEGASRSKIRKLDKLTQEGNVSSQNGVVWTGPVCMAREIRKDGGPSERILHLYDMENVRAFFGRIDDERLVPYDAFLLPQQIVQPA